MNTELMEEKTDTLEGQVPKGFRLLRRNEVVTRGDFLADSQQRMELWTGPTGFRADSFVMPIYRKTRNEG